MTDRELNILKERYNSFRKIQLTTFSDGKLAVTIETLRDVFKWLGLTAEFDNNGYVTYLGNGQEPQEEKYTMMCDKLSIIEPLLQVANHTSLNAYLDGYNQAIKDAGIPIERTAYATYKIKKKEETKE